MHAIAYLVHARALFAVIRRRGERALAQVSDAQFFATLDGESNSLALLVKHISGNALSRWTDFLTTDGEKPSRRRDEEFVVLAADTRAHLMARWGAGWAALEDTLEGLTDADLSREIRIRGEAQSVFEAIERQKEHYAYHVGQLVFLAKHWVGPAWRSLSIPRGGSAAYNEKPAHDRIGPA